MKGNDQRQQLSIEADVRKILDRAGVKSGLVIEALDRDAGKTDAIWFLAHSTRTHRMRFATTLERQVACLDAPFVYALIRQVSPGQRIRVFWSQPWAIPSSHPILQVSTQGEFTDTVIAELFDVLQSGECISWENLISRARAGYRQRGIA